MANPFNKTVILSLDGVYWTLLFDFEAIANAEEVTGRALFSGISGKDVTSPTINLVRAMLYAAVQAYQPATTFAEAKALVTRKNFVDIWTKLLEAWTKSWDEDVEDEVAADPTTDQR
jgi:hypothetical protein